MASDIPIRRAARVLLIDRLDRILLQFFSLDGGSTGVWITPGGGVEDGESHEEAAIRELEEEVGLRNAALGPCVWRRSFVISAWEGRQFEQQELFFVCRVESHDVSRFVIEDEEERRVTTQQRWWSVEEIRAATEYRFGPMALGHLLDQILTGDYPTEPLVIGR